MDGLMDGWMDEGIDGWMDGWMNGWIDEWMEEGVKWRVIQYHRIAKAGGLTDSDLKYSSPLYPSMAQYLFFHPCLSDPVLCRYPFL